MPLLGPGGRLVLAYRRLRVTVVRPKVLAAVIVTTVFAVALLAYASPQRIYLHNVALEVGGDLIGAILVVAILTPLISRARRGRVRERGHLDYDLFTENVAAASAVVRVLDTFSNLFDRPQTPAVLRAIEDSLHRQARVQVLLLHPDSTAAASRAEALHGENLRLEIMRNLRVLGTFADQLDAPLRRRFEVRLYTTGAAHTLYRWDDRAMISFFSLGRLSGDGSQLEILVDSPLGRFVEQHFDDLWSSAATVSLANYRHVTITLRDDTNGSARTFDLPYVQVEGLQYFATDPDAQILAHLARVPAAGGTVRATRADRPGEEHHLRVVSDDDASFHETLRGCFMEKYGSLGQAYLYLTPAGRPPRQRRAPADPPG